MKSNKIIGNLVCIIIIIATTIGALASYNFLKQGLKSGQFSPYERYEFIHFINRSNYVLYADAVLKEVPDSKNSEGAITEPIKAYYSNYDKVMESTYSEDNEKNLNLMYSKDIIQGINDLLLSWNNHISNPTNIDYIVQDDTDNSIIKQTKIEEDNEVNLLKGERISSLYDFYIRVQYDQEGNRKIESVVGADKDEVAKILDSINSEGYLEEQLTSSDYYIRDYDGYDEEGNGYYLINNTKIYDGSNGEAYSSYLKNVSLIGEELEQPHNITIAYGIKKDLEPYDWVYSYIDSCKRMNYVSSGFLFVSCIIVGLVAVLSLLLPVSKKLQIGRGITSKIPIELLIVGGYGFVGSAYLTLVVSYETITGSLLQDLIHTGMVEPVCKFFLVAANIGVWILWLTLTMVWALGFCQIFLKGIRRYLKENCLTIMLCIGIKNFIKRLHSKVMSFFNRFDLTDQSNKKLSIIVLVNALVLSLFACLWFFGIIGIIVYSVVIFIIGTKVIEKVRKDYKYLLKASNEMAQGNLEMEITDDFGVFEPFKEELLKIRHGFKKAVEEEVKSQNMKTELITNVSHDLKTPLTAIITYVDLLKDETITPEERASYINTLEMKSLRLKQLIEDLFEVSKASSKNVEVKREEVDIKALIKQVIFESSDKLTECQIDIRTIFPDNKILLELDSQKTYRIFDNLIVNITRYALPGTRAYIELSQLDNSIQISVKNISREELTFDTQDITERFVRGDKSRNQEGSGLGLAIVKSFMEVQGGKFHVETDADLYKAILIFPNDLVIDKEDEEIMTIEKDSDRL